MRHDEFRKLFSSAKNVSLLNDITGGAFVWDIQNILWDDLLLRLCRLTDRKQSGSKDNLTVRRLPAFCMRESSEMSARIQKLVDIAVTKSEFARDRKNRRISHTDLETKVGNAKPLATASLLKVTSALDAIHAVLNATSKELLDSEIANHVISRPRAQAFLAYTQQISDSLKFIDAVIDPDGTTKVTNTDVATTFLHKLELSPTQQNIHRVIGLREAARRFN